MDFFWSAPVVARTITAITFVESVLVHGQLLKYFRVLFLPRLLFKIWPEVWRLFTPFFLTGGGIGFVFDLYFMYTYASKLETGSPRFTAPGDFFTYVVFVASVIMTPRNICPPSHILAEAVPGNEEDHPCIAYGAFFFDPYRAIYFAQVVLVPYITLYHYVPEIPFYFLFHITFPNVAQQLLTTPKGTAGFILNSVTFTSALILAFVFTYSQDNRGTRTTFIIIQIPTELLPWAMLTLTLVTAGWPAALSEGMGLVAAHLYDFLTRIYPTFGGGRNWITTPRFVRRYFAVYLREGEHRSYGRAFRPSANQAEEPQQPSGWTSSFQNTWGSRGSGRRLGGS
ncbi:hypothetical protein P175DRAFT_0535469 [Aspergillus ochraceoroseus IBT 24754]|uniref:Derlin n=1 Tax=Aspergillus ochraceoroseus IBT 24754 TaxID=1392256 RepID=A0A2T5LN67_9EURO|nr:uncharacterized protein P175DRAFT_0535469 [Aspergillus ochraceoroseus IBT 24754]PTU17722.1 hypothetical protein P175DRAFT_0535469 [Aspergillus ochraceoroseus IBT 24754]